MKLVTTVVLAGMGLAVTAFDVNAQNRDPGCNGNPTGCGTGGGTTVNQTVKGGDTKIAVAPGMGSFSDSCFEEVFLSAGAVGFSGGFGVKGVYNTKCGRVQVLTAGASSSVCFSSVASVMGGGFDLPVQDAVRIAQAECSVTFKPLVDSKDARPTRTKKLAPRQQ